jgi:hypothetical protein
MNKIVRRFWLAFLLLLFGAFGSLFIGEHQLKYERQQQIEKWRTGGFRITHASPDTNAWQTAGFLLFFLSLSIGLAALMLWSQDRKESG